MAVSGKSPLRSLPYLLTTDAPKIHEWGELLALALDKDVSYLEGTLVERNALAHKKGRLFMVAGDTAANNGVMWWDNGASWLALNNKIAGGQVYVPHTFTYSAGVPTEQEPSSTNATFVSILDAIAPKIPGTIETKIYVGGVQVNLFQQVIGEPEGKTFISLPPFIVPPGVKWKAEAIGGSASWSITVNYLTL